MRDVTVSSFAFCPDDYKFEDNPEKAMFNDIGEFIRLCTKNGYHIKIWYDSFCVVVEYDYQKAELSENELRWLHYEDVEKLSYMDEEPENCCIPKDDSDPMNVNYPDGWDEY